MGQPACACYVLAWHSDFRRLYYLGVERAAISIAASYVYFASFSIFVDRGSVHIFREPVVIGAAITQWINGFLTMVQVFYLPTFYQTAYGYSPVKSGLLLLPLTIVQSMNVI
jgi:hypothetical protein